MWRGYCDLKSHNYKHMTVNHSEHLKEIKINEGNMIIHTNNIESLWSAMRDFLSTHHYRHRAHMYSYVREWAARFNVGHEGNTRFCQLFEAYQVNNITSAKDEMIIEVVEDIKIMSKDLPVNDGEDEDKEGEEDSLVKRVKRRTSIMKKFMQV